MAKPMSSPSSDEARAALPQADGWLDRIHGVHRDAGPALVDAGDDLAAAR